MDATPADRGLRMPPEWGPHERTLMAWPARRELWGRLLPDACAAHAAVGNAIAAFEPVTMVAGDPAAAAAARAALTAAVEIVELPIDDSWLRDSGPIYVTGGGRRVAVHWGFNAWGETFTPYDRDAAVGGLLAARLGDEVVRGPMILEGGSIAVSGDGTLLTTEQCLLHPSRNPGLGRDEIEQALLDTLGVRRVVWLGRGLAEDRDTDGHVDLVAAFLPDGRLLLQSAPEGTPDHEPQRENRRRAEAAGLEVVEQPILAHGVADGATVAMSYMNLYLGEAFAIVPVCGDPEADEPALALLRELLPGREVVGVPGLVLAHGGGGPHCITQQVPRADG